MKKYNQRSSEYQNCLIGRAYSPTLVKKQFEEVGRMTKIQAKRKTKSGKKNQFFTSYNLNLPCMNTFIKKHLPLLHSDDNLKTSFPTETFNVVYRRNKSLKELLAPSLFPTPRREN